MVILTRRLRGGVIVIQALGITAPRSLAFESQLQKRQNEEPQNPKPASTEPNCHSTNYLAQVGIGFRPQQNHYIELLSPKLLAVIPKPYICPSQSP